MLITILTAVWIVWYRFLVVTLHSLIGFSTSITRIFSRMPNATTLSRGASTSNGPNSGQKTLESITRHIERQTKRTLFMNGDMTDSNLTKCHPQQDSPLFKLPVELRDLISAFATAQYDDADHKYKETAYFYRPGHTARHKTCFNWLLTCRRAWLEANKLPMQQAEHAFWFQRGPYDERPDSGWAANTQRELARYHTFTRSLHPATMNNITHIRLFTQMFQAEPLARLSTVHASNRHHFAATLYRILAHRVLGVTPKVFQITIRHTDWWDWETDADLRFNEDWIKALLDCEHMGGINEFRLELDTLDRKKAQLQPILDRLIKLEGRHILENPFSQTTTSTTKFVCSDPPQFSPWEGPSRINDQERDVYAGQAKLKYHIVTLSWRAVPAPTPEDPDSLTRCDAKAFIGSIGTLGLPLREYATMTPGVRTRITAPRSARDIMIQRAGRRSLIGPGRTFLQPNETVRRQDTERAIVIEAGRRIAFDRAVGAVKVAELERKWQQEGSLLRFGGFIDVDIS